MYNSIQSKKKNYTHYISVHRVSLGMARTKVTDTTDLEHKAAEFLTNGLPLNTRNTYTAGQQRFVNFCQAINVAPILASEIPLRLFATHLAASNIAYTTIKVYISAIWHIHVTAGLYEEFNTQLTPQLQLTLKGIQRSQGISHPQRIRLLITLEIMQPVNDLLLQAPYSYDNILVWADCCLAFFGFLRVSEFTMPNDTNYDSECHLSTRDISVTPLCQNKTVKNRPLLEGS